MNRVRKIVTWLRLLNKRLYRKGAFLALLVLIPAVVFGYSTFQHEDSGVLTVVLAQEGEDPLSAQVMQQLCESSELLQFRICESPREAEEQLRLGKADSAWIFPENLAASIEQFSKSSTQNNAFVQVLEREANVMLMLAREKLAGTLYHLCAKTVYLNFLRQNIPQMAEASDTELLAYYEGTDIAQELFAFEQADGTVAENTQKVHYLLAPVRGLLAVVIVLCGSAAAMYYIQDTQRGTFAWVPVRQLPVAEFGCQLAAVGNLCIVALLSLSAAGMSGAIGAELLLMVMYTLCVAAFCMALRRLCGSIRALGTLLPLLMVAMLLICPVFFDLGAMRQFQYLFPPTYYINAVHNHRYYLYMLLHTAASGGVYLLSGKLLKRA